MLSNTEQSYLSLSLSISPPVSLSFTLFRISKLLSILICYWILNFVYMVPIYFDIETSLIDIAEARYIQGDPLKGYYDFVITEGSYKFWAVFQVISIYAFLHHTPPNIHKTFYFFVIICNLRLSAIYLLCFSIPSIVSYIFSSWNQFQSHSEWSSNCVFHFISHAIDSIRCSMFNQKKLYFFFILFFYRTIFSFLPPAWWYIPHSLQFITQKWIQLLVIMITQHIWVEHDQWQMIPNQCNQRHHGLNYQAVISFKRLRMDFNLYWMQLRRFRKHNVITKIKI